MVCELIYQCPLIGVRVFSAKILANYITQTLLKYMRKRQVESHLLCYEPLFNTSGIKEKITVPPWVRKCHTCRNTITPCDHIIDRWHVSPGKWFLLPPFSYFLTVSRLASALLESFRFLGK